MAEWCSTARMYHIFFTHSSVGGHSRCSHLLWVLGALRYLLITAAARAASQRWLRYRVKGLLTWGRTPWRPIAAVLWNEGRSRACCRGRRGIPRCLTLWGLCPELKGKAGKESWVRGNSTVKAQRRESMDSGWGPRQRTRAALGDSQGSRPFHWWPGHLEGVDVGYGAVAGLSLQSPWLFHSRTESTLRAGAQAVFSQQPVGKTVAATGLRLWCREAEGYTQ